MSDPGLDPDLESHTYTHTPHVVKDIFRITQKI